MPLHFTFCLYCCAFLYSLLLNRLLLLILIFFYTFFPTPFSSFYMPLQLSFCLYFCAFSCSSFPTPYSLLLSWLLSLVLIFLASTPSSLHFTLPFVLYAFPCPSFLIILDFVSCFLIRAPSLTSFFNLISLLSAPLPLPPLH